MKNSAGDSSRYIQSKCSFLRSKVFTGFPRLGKGKIPGLFQNFSKAFLVFLKVLKTTLHRVGISQTVYPINRVTRL